MATDCKETYTQIERLICDFCKIILTKKDGLNVTKAKRYIDDLTDDDKKYLNFDSPETDSQIRFIVQKNVTDYLQLYDNFSTPDSIEHPFEFDSGGAYPAFLNSCVEHYREKNSSAHFPSVLKFTLDYIQEMSEHYRVFSYFYDVRYKETSSQVLSEVSEIAEEKVFRAIKNVSKETAEKSVKEEVDNKMTYVSGKITETSVTILGIFAGIVLTVVAGLFYSSSVLDNINSGNFYRLLCVSALVGLVCIYLIVAMFRFIARIGEKEKKKFFSDKFMVSISGVLIFVMIVGFIGQIIQPNVEVQSDASKYDVDISINDKNTTDENVVTSEPLPTSTSTIVPTTTPSATSVQTSIISVKE